MPHKTKLQVYAARQDLESYAPVSSTYCHSQSVPGHRKDRSTDSPNVHAENAADNCNDLDVDISGLILNMWG